MADPGAFLQRWSRLKRKAQAEGVPRSGTARPQPADGPPAANAAAPPAPTKPVEELPPIETLGKDSDYAAFMRADVPDALRNQALRKLWQSDPVFANLDGLVDYGEDFGAGFTLGGAVATAYRVLEGMPGGEAEQPAGAEGATEQPAAATPAAAPAADPPPCAIAEPASGAVAGGPKHEIELD